MSSRKKGDSKSQDSSFEDPPLQGSSTSSSEMDDLVDPSVSGSFSTEGSDAEDAGVIYSGSSASAADQQVLAAKQSIEQFMMQGGNGGNGGAGVQSLGGASANVMGVGIGSAKVDANQMHPDGPGTPTLNVYVAEAVGQEELRAALFDNMDVQAASDDQMPINIVVTGIIDAQPNRFKDRPAPGGISIGNARSNSAGTLGCLARGRSAPRNNYVLLLTNNHVAALSNAGNYGDSIVQPGRLDGGVNTADRIAILERFITIYFDGRPNYVDCATGWCWHALVRRELVYLVGSTKNYFRVSSAPRQCAVNMVVGKTGRTTQLKAGRITDCNATISVNYGGGKVALFRDQIAITGLAGQFSAPGDSGSLIWSWDNVRNPVGLLFAGGGNMTFANKIGRVLTALDINLYT